jgi:hypothetical protein
MTPALAEPPTEEHPVTRPKTTDFGARFDSLAEAVHRHERETAGPAVPRRQRDHLLYRRLAALEGKSQ